MGVAHVRGHLHPGLCLVLCVDSGCISVESRIVHDAAVIEIACASVIFQLACGSAHGNVVFLTEGVVEGLLVPVVRTVVVFPVSVAKGRMRVQPEVLTYELLALRNGIDLISQTSVIVVEEIGVSICICLGWGLARIYLRVVHHTVVGFVVLGGVGNHVILRDQA